MQHYIDLFREQLGSDDMHSTPFLDAAHKIVDELKKATATIERERLLYHDGLVKRTKDTAEQCVECVESMICHCGIGYERAADSIRDRFNLPKAG